MIVSALVPMAQVIMSLTQVLSSPSFSSFYGSHSVFYSACLFYRDVDFQFLHQRFGAQPVA